MRLLARGKNRGRYSIYLSGATHFSVWRYSGANLSASPQRGSEYDPDNLERTGQVINGNDLMIATIALARGLALVTHSSEELPRAPGLQVED